MSPGILGQKNWNDAGVPAGRQVVPVDPAPGRPLHGGAALRRPTTDGYDAVAAWPGGRTSRKKRINKPTGGT